VTRMTRINHRLIKVVTNIGFVYINFIKYQIHSTVGRSVTQRMISLIEVREKKLGIEGKRFYYSWPEIEL
jgi:hypothetical protein